MGKMRYYGCNYLNYNFLDDIYEQGDSFCGLHGMAPLIRMGHNKTSIITADAATPPSTKERRCHCFDKKTTIIKNNNMTREEEDKVLAGIHAALEEMQGSDNNILFIEGRCNRGLISGSIEGLAALFAWNMAAYPQFRIIMAFAEKLYSEHRPEIEKIVADEKPTHEIVNNFGHDFKTWIKNLEKR